MCLARLGPHEGLECLLVKMGHTGPLAEPRRAPQAGKSGDPRSQNADNFHLTIGVLWWVYNINPGMYAVIPMWCVYMYDLKKGPSCNTTGIAKDLNKSSSG